MATRRGGVKGGRKLREFFRKAKAAQGGGVRKIEVGWFEGEKYPDGPPVPVVATVHEFGSPRRGIKESASLRKALIDIEKTVRPALVQGLDPRTMTLDQATATNVARLAEARIRLSITLHRLIDTKRLRESVDHRLVSD